MKTFTISYVVTERTIHKTTIEADTLEEAIKDVTEYNFDNSQFELVDSLEWSVNDVEEFKP